MLFNQENGIKNYANEKASDILFKKIDVITYFRNMILFDIINKFIIDEDKTPILNFLCRPIISLNKNEKNIFDDFYKIFKERDFNKFSNKIIELNKKPKEKEKQIKFISLSHEHLKNFI